ncbi:hypothetical protein FJTKL_12090 [Diaporthe vaccinii]|uniref:Uncharacterized protein n=1 Tax=Diaporthe vaccinii TaxID=105482 RepID=A0ABR4EF96_9PEZI
MVIVVQRKGCVVGAKQDDLCDKGSLRIFPDHHLRTTHDTEARIIGTLDLIAVVFADQSRINDATIAKGDQAKEYLALQRSIFYITVISLIVTMLFAMLGLVTTANPKWLGKYSICQMIYGLMLVSIGGYVAERVRECEDEFEKLSADSKVSYYSVIYYGHVAQAAYGFVLITVSLVLAAIIPMCEVVKF